MLQHRIKHLKASAPEFHVVCTSFPMTYQISMEIYNIIYWSILQSIRHVRRTDRQSNK